MRMRMLSFLPFSVERRFPVIPSQCKHSLSTAVAVVASDLIANSVFDDDRGRSGWVSFGSTLSAAHNGPIVRRLSSRISSFRPKDTAAAAADNPDSLVTLHRRSSARLGVNEEPTTSIEGSAQLWIVTRRFRFLIRGCSGPSHFSSSFGETENITFPNLMARSTICWKGSAFKNHSCNDIRWI